jgi:hypothetical protein
MGLLGKAIAINAHIGSGASGGGSASDGGIAAGSHASGSYDSLGVQSFIADFHRKNPQFHGIVLQGSSTSAVSQGEHIYDMVACHGAEVADLPGKNILVLLPGALDRELFAHRLGQSTGLPLLSQLSADSPSLALVTLSPYLQ